MKMIISSSPSLQAATVPASTADCSGLVIGILPRLLLQRRLLRLRRASATTLLDSGGLELVLIRSECAVDLHVVVGVADRLDVFFGVIGNAEFFGPGPQPRPTLLGGASC